MADQNPSVRTLRILLTASEAYPALEQAFLDAQTEIRASFLVFDLRTKLRSDAARAVGETWFDLLVHTLRRGVAVYFVHSDVDPVGRPALHCAAMRNLRHFCAAAEVAGPDARLTVTCARHPAQTGLAVRLGVWPYMIKKLRGSARALNRMPAAERTAALRDLPGLAKYLRRNADGTVSARIWGLPPLFPATHHQKLAVFDGKLLYVGGLDLDERRFDTPRHGRPGAETWHDVQLLISGRAAQEAQAHLETFADVVAERASAPHARTLLRTLSVARKNPVLRFGPKPHITELRGAHVALLRRSHRLIYLETQYFRDRDLARQLARQARETPGLGLILILPAAPDDLAFEGKRGLDTRYGEAMQASALRILRRGFGSRLFVGSPAQPRRALPDGADTPDRRDRLHGAPLVYVHAKVSIFDERGAIVSSANLNGRSLRWDTEAGVYLNAPNDITELRHRVMAHWLPPGAPPDALAVDTALPIWRRIAADNARLRPDQRKGFLLPHDFAAAEAFGVDLPLVPEEMV